MSLMKRAQIKLIMKNKKIKNKFYISVVHGFFICYYEKDFSKEEVNPHGKAEVWQDP